MAIARVQDTGAVNNSVAFAGNNTAGNLLVACIQAFANITAVSDTAGNTWVKAVDLDEAGAPLYGDIWYVKNCAGGANTVSFTESAGFFRQIWVGEYSGIDTTAPLDKTVAALGSAAVHTAFDSGATATTSQADELLVGMVCDGNGNSATWTQPSTEQWDDSSARHMSVADEIVSATGTYHAQGTLVNNTANEPVLLATFKAAAGGEETPTTHLLKTGAAPGTTWRLSG